MLRWHPEDLRVIAVEEQVASNHPVDALQRRDISGVVRGMLRRDLHMWRGIPYAAPPIGELRFRAP